MRPIKHNIKEGKSFEKNHLPQSDMKEKHMEDLGLGVPDNYFSASRSEILALTSEKKKNGRIVQLKKTVIWMVAAGIAVLLTLAVFYPDTQAEIDRLGVKISDSLEQIRGNPSGRDLQLDQYDGVLVASLFLDETEIDQFAEEHFLQEIIVEEYIDLYFIENDLIFD